MTGRGVSVTERVRQRIRAWLELQGHGGQRVMLRRMKDRSREDRGDQWLSDIKNSKQGITLDDLDVFAEAMEMPPGELVRAEGQFYWELSAQEATVVRWFRALAWDGRRYFLSWLEAIGAIRHGSPVPNDEKMRTEQKSTRRRKNIVVETNYPMRLQIGASTDELWGAANGATNQGNSAVDLSGERLPATVEGTDQEIEQLARRLNILQSHRETFPAAPPGHDSSTGKRQAGGHSNGRDHRRHPPRGGGGPKKDA